MKAGFCEKDITPPVGTFLVGFGYRDKGSEGITDPIFLRTMALEDDKNNRFVMVTADIIYFPKDMSWRIKMWAERELDIKSSSVLLNASHTHCGPQLKPVDYKPNYSLNIDYVESFEKAIYAGIKTAIENLEDVQIKSGIFESHFGINRRNYDKNGVPKMFPNEEGYYDSDLPIIAFYNKDSENIKAVFYSYACHPSSKGGYNISADYPGAISRYLKKKLGSDICTIFAQGAGGSAKPRFYDKKTMVFVGASVEEVEELGEQVGSEIIDNINSNKMKALTLKIDSVEKEFVIPFDRDRMPSDDELWDYIEGKKTHVVGHIYMKRWAQKIMEAKRQGNLQKRYTAHISRIRISDNFEIISMSGEAVAEVGRMAKDIYKDKNIIFLGYCNYTEIYIPTSLMLEEGGYEPEYSIKYHPYPAQFAKNIDEIIKTEVSSLSLND